jgi:hypothetical protein
VGCAVCGDADAGDGFYRGVGTTRFNSMRLFRVLLNIVSFVSFCCSEGCVDVLCAKSFSFSV